MAQEQEVVPNANAAPNENSLVSFSSRSSSDESEDLNRLDDMSSKYTTQLLISRKQDEERSLSTLHTGDEGPIIEGVAVRARSANQLTITKACASRGSQVAWKVKEREAGKW